MAQKTEDPARIAIKTQDATGRLAATAHRRQQQIGLQLLDEIIDDKVQDDPGPKRRFPFVGIRVRRRA